MPEKNAPNLEQLKKQSKELHHAHQTGDDAAIRRVAEHHPRLAGAAPAVVRAHRFTLSDAQLVIAREHNCASWPVLKEAIAPVAAQAAHDKPSARMTQPEHLRGAVLRRDGVTVDGDQAWALFCACADGDLPVVRQLITANPDLNYAQIWYVKPIALAMGGGHTRVVELLLQHDKAHRLARGVYGHNGQWIGRREVLRRGYRQLDRAVMRYKHARAPRYSPEFHTLQEAIETRDLNRINTVLDATPALLHATDLQGNGALHLAVFTRQLEIVEDILDRGAEIDCERGDGVTPLLASLDPRGWGQAMAITSYLLARGARYTLSAAAAVGHAGKLTQALREAPEAIRDLDANEYSPLRYAALGNHATVLRILLEHGADPNRSERDAPQGGALWWACRSDSRDAIRLLLAHGAAAHAEYDSGGCCLSIYSGSDRIAQLLRDHGAFDYPYMMDTAKMKQAVRDNLPVVRYLGHHYWGDFYMAVVGHGDLELLDLYVAKAGVERLSQLAWRHAYATAPAFIARLVALGVNPNKTDWCGRTVLHWCAEKNDVSTAALYLQHGAAIDSIDVCENTTPLGYAARHGHTAMVRFLLEHGADPTLPHEEWARPQAYAELEGHTEVAAILKASA